MSGTLSLRVVKLFHDKNVRESDRRYKYQQNEAVGKLDIIKVYSSENQQHGGNRYGGIWEELFHEIPELMMFFVFEKLEFVFQYF